MQGSLFQGHQNSNLTEPAPAPCESLNTSVEPPSLLRTSQTFQKIKTLEALSGQRSGGFGKGGQTLRGQAAGAGGGLCPHGHTSEPRAAQALSCLSLLIRCELEAPDTQGFSRKPERPPMSQDGGEWKGNCWRPLGGAGSGEVVFNEDEVLVLQEDKSSGAGWW